jgi:lipopolysaccharide/colanic/teichoic acid biosynthesis glycosyltransferase
MTEPTTERLKVLYIGNDPALIDLFSQSGLFDMTVKENGLQAIYWLTDNAFRLFDMDKDTRFDVVYDETRQLDAIISEFMLPGINALTFYRKLKLNSIHSRTPFVVISPLAYYDAKAEAYNMGVDDFFQSNISIPNIHSRLTFLRKFKAEYVPKPHTFQDEDMTPYITPFAKRAFDILMAGTALIVLSPIMLITVVAILLESRGKVYYISKRVGSNYKIFDFYKFRSMYPDADKRIKDVAHLNQYISDTVDEECSDCAALPAGQKCSPTVYFDGEEICETLANKRRNAKKAFLKIVDDPRITKVGKLIRRSSIDELPQLFNILKGDMSIVGNRPLPLNEAEALTKKKWSRRFRAPAGLTGLWQVEKRGRNGVMSEEERFALDNYYAEHHSFWGDMRIIFRTFSAVVAKENV